MTDKDREPGAATGSGSATDDTDAAAEPANDLTDGATPGDGTEGGAEEPWSPDVEPEPEPPAAPTAATGRRARDRGPVAPVGPVAASVSEQAVHIGDRASAVFVVGVVGVFVALLAYGMLFGQAGFISGAFATPTPLPFVTQSPVVTPSSSASVAPSSSSSPAPSSSAAPSPSAAPSASPAPSPSAAASPSPSPS